MNQDSLFSNYIDSSHENDYKKYSFAYPYNYNMNKQYDDENSKACQNMNSYDDDQHVCHLKRRIKNKHKWFCKKKNVFEYFTDHDFISTREYLNKEGGDEKKNKRKRKYIKYNTKGNRY